MVGRDVCLSKGWCRLRVKTGRKNGSDLLTFEQALFDSKTAAVTIAMVQADR